MAWQDPQPTGKWSLYMAQVDQERHTWVGQCQELVTDKSLEWRLLATTLDHTVACKLAGRLLSSPLYCAAQLVAEMTVGHWSEEGRSAEFQEKENVLAT